MVTKIGYTYIETHVNLQAKDPYVGITITIPTMFLTNGMKMPPESITFEANNPDALRYVADELKKAADELEAAQPKVVKGKIELAKGETHEV